MLSRNRIKYIQSLARKKDRDLNKSFIAETPKVINEFLNSSYKIKTLFGEMDWIEANGEKLHPETEVIPVTSEELGRISQLKTPHSVLSEIQFLESKLKPDIPGKISIALDDLQDPGNMGTILRIADWFGIENIICSTDTVDVYNPKVVQASMGSLAHVDIHYVVLEEYLSNTGVPVYATSMRGTSIYEIPKISEGIIVIGNEGRGIREDIIKLSKDRLSIPRVGRAESLNAAVATGIIMSHLVSAIH